MTNIKIYAYNDGVIQITKLKKKEKAMEKQEKFLNKQYLETRVREVKEIRQKKMKFDITESDRLFSKTLYVNFYCFGENGKWFKEHTLRVSDHVLEDCYHSQFIVDPNENLTKKKKAQFLRVLELAVKKAQIRNFYKEIENVSKENETNE